MTTSSLSLRQDVGEQEASFRRAILALELPSGEGHPCDLAETLDDRWARCGEIFT